MKVVDNTRQLESTNEANRLEISQLNNRLAEERQRHEQSSHDYITNVTRLRTEVIVSHFIFCHILNPRFIGRSTKNN
jgi:hypothetical protein